MEKNKEINELLRAIQLRAKDRILLMRQVEDLTEANRIDVERIAEIERGDRG